MTGDWQPFTRGYTHRRCPHEGDVVGWDYTAWLVEHVQAAIPTPEEEERLTQYTPASRDERRPYRVTLRRLYGPPHRYEKPKNPDVVAVRIDAGSLFTWPVYQGGRVPLCSCCGHPWPCREMLAEEKAERVAAETETLAERAELGACFGCGEPVTARQEVIAYPDMNVRVPLGPPPVFHARQACREYVVAYEKDRARVNPEAAPLVDVKTRAVLRDGDGRLVEHHPESYHAAYYRAVALDGDPDGRLPSWASVTGRRDMWLIPGRPTRKCACGRGLITHVGGNHGCGLTKGCRACMSEFVEYGYDQAAIEDARRATTNLQLRDEGL